MVKIDMPCAFDHNGECLLCDCWSCDCAYLRFLDKNYTYESKERLEEMFKDYKLKSMKVSFDFDNTLERPEVQRYAKKLIDKGIEVHITTTRWDEENIHKYTLSGFMTESIHNDLYTVMEDLGIPKDRLKFTNMQYKAIYLKDTDFLWHLDDNPTEIELMIENKCRVSGVCYSLPGWKEITDLLIKRNEDNTHK